MLACVLLFPEQLYSCVEKNDAMEKKHGKEWWHLDFMCIVYILCTSRNFRVLQKQSNYL